MGRTYQLDYRNIRTDFWTDAAVLKMPIKEKAFYLYLLTNPRITFCGIYEMPVDVASVELKLPAKEVLVLLTKFDEIYHKIAWSIETEEVAIVNWLKYNNFSERQQMGFDNALKAVKCARLRETVMGMQWVSNGITIPLQRDGHIYNPSLNISLNDSNSDLEETKDEEQKRSHGELLNVFLTEAEYEKLKLKMPDDVEDYIERLSSYMKSKKKTYEDHYATILAWKRKDDADKKEKQQEAGALSPRVDKIGKPKRGIVL